MIAITPFLAEYKVYAMQPDGSHKHVWQPCKVLGVIKPDGHDPEYLIEIYHGGTSSLTTTDEVKRNERGNPL
ncbi:hypothetical protein ACC810_30540 [Rhizobium ruizarguesonis]